MAFTLSNLLLNVKSAKMTECLKMAHALDAIS
jgi:hypothetical protein